ncbi:hypothetical protein ANN_19431 [Periplaneta americana]|uniref:Uncharacterized protein n=1 Tax=Periplaneta americana TaxID=6978 RepID=A0ABQ8SA25_PERAM|nr:hypothetical protein ANN_19431 [Periplaneta americana]
MSASGHFVSPTAIFPGRTCQKLKSPLGPPIWVGTKNIFTQFRLELNGFKETGICPPNRNIFSEADFLAAVNGKTCSMATCQHL